jgi:hypothetical protein
MKKYLKSTKQSIDYSSMESGDHSTNGANPKSLTSRGNKIIIALIGFLLCIGSIPSLAQDIDPKKEVQTQYMRPSVTTLFIDVSANYTREVIDALSAHELPKKFNDHSVSTNEFVISDTLNDATIKALLEASVTKYIVQKWFPYDTEAKAHSTKVIEERGVYNATDADVIASKASARKEALLKDVGEQLLNYSYIIIYAPYNIEQINKQTAKGQSKGYKGICKVSVWKLDWNEEVKNNFYNQWEQANAFNSVAFPVVKAVDLLLPIKSEVTIDPKKPLTDEDLINIFAKAIQTEADIQMTRNVDDFQVKAPIAKVKRNYSFAKIGTKESVTIDKRFFASEIIVDEEGNQDLKRKGVVRATSKIAQNDTIATGDGPSTKFYQTYGKRLKEGMLLTENPDYGVGLTVMGGPFSANGRLELGIGMYASTLVKKIKVPYGLKAYAQIGLPFATMEVEGKKVVLGDDNKEQTFLVYSAGISKDFYFARRFALTPYVGYSALLIPDDYTDEFEATYATQYSPSSFEGGINFSVAILHNIQVIANLGYNQLTGTWYNNPVQANIGIRYQR